MGLMTKPRLGLGLLEANPQLYLYPPPPQIQGIRSSIAFEEDYMKH
jgi:hypothetical protein